MGTTTGLALAWKRPRAVTAWAMIILMFMLVFRPTPAAAAGAISITPSSAASGYAQPITISVTGTGTSFQENLTNVTVLDGSNNVQNVVSGLAVSSATALSFTMGTGLAQGNYTVRVSFPGGEDTTPFTVTGPASISLSQSDIGSGYGTGATITVTGTNTHFVQGTTTVALLDNTNTNTGKVNSVSVTNSTRFTFNLATGLTKGDYMLRVTTGGESATTSFTVTDPPAVTLSPTGTSEGYSSAVSVAVTGVRTHFVQGATAVTLLDGDNATVGSASGVTVSSPTSVSFNIGTGLTEDAFTARIVTGAETVDGTFTVSGAPTMTLTTTEVSQGYTSALSVTATGNNTHFSSGQTVVSILDSESNSAGTVSGVTVSNATSLSFSIDTGLTAASYKVRAVTGSETVDADLTVLTSPAISLSQSSVAAGYASALSLSATGQRTHFSDGQTAVSLLDAESSSVGTITNVTVSGSTGLSFKVGIGLEPGAYTLRVTTNVERAETTFTVTEAASVTLSASEVAQGYGSAVSVTATGTNTSFDGTTAVTILDSDNNSAGSATITNVGGADSLTFSIATGLNAGSHTIRLVTGSETVTADFTVTEPASISISPSSVATGYSNRTVTVTGANTHFVAGTSAVTITSGGDAYANVSNTAVASATSLSFTLTAGLTDGSYTIKVTTGVENATATLEISNKASMTISPDTLAENYASTATITATGVGTQFLVSPQVTLTGPAPATTNQSVVSNASAASNEAMTFQVATGLAVGVYTVSIVANTITTTATLTVEVDATAPTLTATAPTGSTWYKPGETVAVAFSVLDDASGITGSLTPTVTLEGAAVTNDLAYTRNNDLSGTVSGAITIPAAGLTTGAKSLNVQLADRSGNIGIGTKSLNVDATTPGVSISTPAADTTYKKGDSISVTAAVTDTNAGLADSPGLTVTLAGQEVTHSLVFTKDPGGSSGAIAGSVTVPDGLSGAAASILSVSLPDKAGNAGSGSVSLTVDSVAPVWSASTLTATPASPTGVDLTWSGASDSSAGGVKQYKIFLNNSAIATVLAPTTSYTATGLQANTSSSFRVEAEDNALNRSSTGPTVSATIDTQAPAFSFTSPSGSTWYRTGQSVSVVASVTDNAAGIANGTALTVELGGQAVPDQSLVYTSSGNLSGSISGSLTVPAAINTAGAKNLNISLQDKSSNTGIGTATVSVDPTLPSLTFNSPASGQTYKKGEQMTVSVSVTDTGSGFASASTITATLAGNPVTGLTFSRNADGLTGTISGTVNLDGLSGSKALVIGIADQAGNSSSVNQTINADAVEPTITFNLPSSGASFKKGDSIAVDATVTEAGLGLPVNPTLTATLNGNAISGLTVNRAADGLSATITGNVAVPDGLGGSYQLALSISDSAGNAGTAARPVTIDSSRPTWSDGAVLTGTTLPAAETTPAVGEEPTDETGPDAGVGEPGDSSAASGVVPDIHVRADGNAEMSAVVDPNKLSEAALEADLVIDLSASSVPASTGSIRSAVVVKKDATVPAAVLESLQGNERNVMIDAGAIRLDIPPAALTGLSEAQAAKASGSEVNFKITVEAVDMIRAATAHPTLYTSVRQAQAKGQNPVSQVLVLDVELITTPAGSSTAVSQSITKFSQKLTVRIPYTSAVRPELLGVYRLNPTSGEWEYRGGKVDPAARTVEAELDGFSEYVVMEYMRSFDDVTTHWAKADIEIMAARHVARGVSETEFNPDGRVTRAEFATLAVRALGLSGQTPGNWMFSDIKPSDWFSEPVGIAASAHLILGDQGRFRPNDLITRQEMAVILSRALQQKAPTLTSEQVEANLNRFTDRSQIAEWANSSVASMVELKLMSGRSASTYDAKANATRAEAVVVLKRMLQYLNEM